MVVSLVALIAAFLSQATQPAEIDNEPVGDVVIMGAWTNPADCSRAKARHVTVAELSANAERLTGQCVVVDGYWFGNALFRSKRDAKSRESSTTRQLSRKRIGLYARWEVIGKSPEKPAHTQFVGRVGTCETQWSNAIMVMGYCHYTNGPILLVSEAFSN